MASKRGSRKSVAFREESPQDIWCKYCSKIYDEPKVLPCLHSFCKRCIGLITGENETSVFCPECRAEVALPSKKLDDLQPNIIIVRKLEELERQKLRQREEDCSGCENGHMASHRCIECQEFLCNDCTQAHQRVKFTREHEILSLEEFVDRTNPKEDSMYATCAKHSTENIDMYCKTCDLLTCKECRRTTDHEAGHEIVSLQNAVDSIKPTLLSLLDATQKNIPALQKSVYEIIKVYGRWQNKIDDVSWQIRRTSRRLIQAVKEKEHQMLKELNTIRDNRSSVLVNQKEEIERKLVCTIDGCDFSDEILKQGTGADILAVNSLICQRLCELQESKIDAGLNNVQVGFDPDERPILEAIKDTFGSISVGHEPAEQASNDAAKEPTDKSTLSSSLPNGGSSVSFASADDDETSASSLSSDSQKPSADSSLSSTEPATNQDPKSPKKAKGRRFSFPALTVGKKTSEPVGKLTPTEFVIPTTDSRGRPREVGVQLESPDGSVISAKVLDNKNGTYSIFYCPRSPGEHNLFVSLSGKHIKHGRRVLNFYGSFSGLKGEELTLVCKTLCLIKWHVTPGLVQVKDGKKVPNTEMNFQEVGQSEA